MPESKYLCGIFSIQERLEHGNCGFGFLLVVLSPRTAAKEEEEREGGERGCILPAFFCYREN